MKLIVLAPRRMSGDDLSVVSSLRAQASSQSAAFQQITLVSRSVRSQTNWCLDVSDRTSPMGLYREAHVVPLAVLALRKPVVALLEGQVDHRRNRTMATLLRYKAFYRFVDGTSATSAFVDATGWCNSTNCDGVLDPRAIPLHAFCPDDDRQDLSTLTGRRAFDQTYRYAGVRHDFERREWQRGPDHTRIAHTVAGFAFPVGFHWDVQSKRHRTRIWTGDSEWRIERGGHLNVAPDASARQGSRSKRTA
jgi:hypothetical protein